MVTDLLEALVGVRGHCKIIFLCGSPGSSLSFLKRGKTREWLVLLPRMGAELNQEEEDGRAGRRPHSRWVPVMSKASGVSPQQVVS